MLIFETVNPRNSSTFLHRQMAILNIFFEGCCHGSLNAIYDAILKANKSRCKIDLLLIGGDFQSLRTTADYNALSVPPKYRTLGDFSDYFTGKKKAPVLTIFVGGNHEASNYLQELYYGGWVAPNIYYLGKTGSVIYKNKIRISGLSGIYNQHSYTKPNYEVIPYNNFCGNALRTVYHVRNYDIAKLELFQKALKMAALENKNEKGTDQLVDIFVSHDWPEGIAHYGNLKKLLSNKPFFKADIAKNELGSPSNMRLLKSIKPKYWLSAHLHVGFKAQVNHSEESHKEKVKDANKTPVKPVIVKNDEEIDIDMDDLMDESNDKQHAQPVKNEDEIELDLDEPEISTEATVTEHAEEKQELEANLVNVQSKDEDGIKLDMKPTSDNQENKSSQVSTTDSIRDSEADTLSKNKDLLKKSLETSPAITQFIALDKCLRNRKFFEHLEIPENEQLALLMNKLNPPSNSIPGSPDSEASSTSSLKRKRSKSPEYTNSDFSPLSYDPEWLAVVKTMNDHFPIAKSKSNVEHKEDNKQDETNFQPDIDYQTGNWKFPELSLPLEEFSANKIYVELEKNRKWVYSNLQGKLAIPSWKYYFRDIRPSNYKNFENKRSTTEIEKSSLTPETKSSEELSNKQNSAEEYFTLAMTKADTVPIVNNPQTVYFCSLLEIENKVETLANTITAQTPKEVLENANKNNNRPQNNNNNNHRNNNRQRNFQNTSRAGLNNNRGGRRNFQHFAPNNYQQDHHQARNHDDKNPTESGHIDSSFEVNSKPGSSSSSSIMPNISAKPFNNNAPQYLSDSSD